MKDPGENEAEDKNVSLDEKDTWFRYQFLRIKSQVEGHHNAIVSSWNFKTSILYIYLGISKYIYASHIFEKYHRNASIPRTANGQVVWF